MPDVSGHVLEFFSANGEERETESVFFFKVWMEWNGLEFVGGNFLHIYLVLFLQRKVIHFPLHPSIHVFLNWPTEICTIERKGPVAKGEECSNIRN